MRITSDKHGQFIVIAALMISILVVSVSAIMYGTVTYFRHERWEEYLSLIDTLKIGSRRVVEIGLANYTMSMNNNALKDNLNKWRINLTKAYSGFGIVLNPELANGSYQAYGVNINYSLGLSSFWYTNASFSAANVTLQMNITSIGLSGYKFVALVFLQAEILDSIYDNVKKTLTIYLIVKKEGSIPVINLRKGDFNVTVDGQSKNFTLTRYYSDTYSSFIYEIQCTNVQTQPSTTSVTAVDSRGIKVIATTQPSLAPIMPAVVGYRSDTGSYGVDSPKVRTWNGTSWSLENELSSAGSPVRFVRAAYSPVAARYYEKIVVTLSDDGHLDAYVWNGTSWIVTNIALINTSSYRMFDIEYEKTSGEALLVYSNGYRIWNGSSWLDETPYNITTPASDVYWIALAQNPTSGSDEIALIALDRSRIVYGLIWNGSQFSESKLLGVAPSETTECIAVAYESISGNATFVWAEADRYSYSIQWNGSAWDASPTQIDLSGVTIPDVWLSLKADPISDRLMLLDVDDAEDLNTAYWNGSSWTATQDHDTSVDTKTFRSADLEWESSESKILMVWGTSNNKLSYKTWTPSGGWSSENTISGMAGTHPWVQLKRNPLSTDATKILGATLNSNWELSSLTWDGTTLTGTTAAFTADTSGISYECFEIEFQKFVNSP